jgi:hypothetical protein
MRIEREQLDWIGEMRIFGERAWIGEFSSLSTL